jgi:hypothetical protein
VAHFSVKKPAPVWVKINRHSSIQVTQRYIDVNDDQLAAAVELL